MEENKTNEYKYSFIDNEMEISRNNVLQRLCENSQDIIESDSTSEDLKYELNDNDIIQCHVHTDDSQPEPIKLVQGQYFLINNLPANNKISTNRKTNGIGGRLICPKIVPETESTSSNLTNKRSCLFEPSKKRDDKRRATHNEVERRRRDKINSWIFKLKEMMPESAIEPVSTDSKSKQSSNDSKSDTLIKACNYIKQMQEELCSLHECLKENEILRDKMRKLEKDNEQLRSQLSVTNASKLQDIIIKLEPKGS